MKLSLDCTKERTIHFEAMLYLYPVNKIYGWKDGSFVHLSAIEYCMVFQQQSDLA